MKNEDILTQVALRYKAIYLDINRKDIRMDSTATVPVMAFVERLRETGFCLSEELLHALNGVDIHRLAAIVKTVNDVMGVNLNWATLVRGWNVPTGEDLADHLCTWLANELKEELPIKGTTLPCGHLIPEGTFPLERYTGCPFCGTPFEVGHFVYKGQGSQLKELRLFVQKDMEQLLRSLMESSTPLDATQKDSLKLLLEVLPVPTKVFPRMKETVMLVIQALVKQGREDEAEWLLSTPTDVLRYLWYEKTGQVQIIKPRTLIARSRKLYYHLWGPLDVGEDAAAKTKQNLRLKYDRPTCLRVAKWLNALPLMSWEACEDMNPKRGMWVRMIRALRLGEYSRKEGFEHLADILDAFYHHRYTTWQNKVENSILDCIPRNTLDLLKERPGAFARCLFSFMLRMGGSAVLKAFDEVSDQVPMRLLVSLGNAAENYFLPEGPRYARPITGGMKQIKPNLLLDLYSEEMRQEMVSGVKALYLEALKRRFASLQTEARSIYIDPQLYHIPISVGDRSTTIQDTSCALMGTRFPVEGDAVRLFLQWGKGLHAQPLDMDLSCRIDYDNDQVDICYYGQLTCPGAKHGGDIRSIPEMVGTAEYIELSLPELQKRGARYATFTCNAYSCGSLSPNLVVGWMNSEYPMKISEENGVAYDPSCVQHMVRISENDLSKALVFGVLDIQKREIIWLEMPFISQTIHGADSGAVKALLKKLEAKQTIGQILDIKAEAQGLQKTDAKEEADEVYDYEWALNPAEVSRMLYS